MIWLLDFNSNRFSYVSPSVVRLRGYSVEEVLQQDMAAALTPAVSRQLSARLADFAAGDDTVITQTHEVMQNCKDGSTVATEVVTTLIYDSQRRVTHLQGVTRDITERKRAEETLKIKDAMLANIASQVPGMLFQFVMKPERHRPSRCIGRRRQFYPETVSVGAAWHQSSGGVG